MLPVQCTATTLRTGRRCQRETLAGGLCGLHRAVEARRQGKPFHSARLSEEERKAVAATARREAAEERRQRSPSPPLSDDEREAVAAAAHMEGVDGEIAILRVLIRRFASSGDLDAVGRGVNTLVRTLKARHALDGSSASQLTTSLDRVLETLADEANGQRP